jgi:hypothetical protein
VVLAAAQLLGFGMAAVVALVATKPLALFQSLLQQRIR